MRRGTTPTHTFDIGMDTAELAQLVVTYCQGDKTVLEKRLADCKLDGTTVIVELTQEETLLFRASREVQIQMRVLTNTGNALASDIISKSVDDVLNSEVLA